MTTPNDNPFRPAGGLTTPTLLQDLDRAVMDLYVALEGLASQDLSQDDMLEVLALLRKVSGSKSGVKTTESDFKTRLWALIGGTAGKYKSPRGRAFQFRRGAKVRRSVKYTDLQARFPEAYSACVTETAVDLNSPAALYL